MSPDVHLVSMLAFYLRLRFPEQMMDMEVNVHPTMLWKIKR